ncbi:MAG TPA: serine/threonine-protein kinase, partial [Gemmataceae bacterium]
MAADRAPDPQTLRRFLAGELPDADLEAVGAYLRDHPDALDRVEAPADTLLAALRDSSTLSDLDAPDVRGLIDRFTALSPDGGGPAAGDEDPAAALGPPERPGDLGRLGGYHVLRVLGRGGMGVVFEAEDPRLGRKVALKVMTRAAAQKPGARERFLREARAAAAVDHDHITPIFQVGEDRGVPFLAMPLLRGETLDERLQCGPPLTATEAAEIGRQMAEGLAAAHAAGLIHRDVKPSNVWLERTPDGAFKRVRIFDFGLAKAAAGVADPAAGTLTRSGMIVGTPTYMAPEQARGLAVDRRADLFSLGCVLYQMAT